jgi:transposase
MPAERAPMRKVREVLRLRHAVALPWEEYRAEHADGYGYSRFRDLYRAWRGTFSPTMRPMHGPAEKLSSTSRATRCRCSIPRPMERRAHIFVAVLCIHLHLCGAAPVGRAGRLDRHARQHARRRRWRAEGHCLRQPEGRRHGDEPL